MSISLILEVIKNMALTEEQKKMILCYLKSSANKNKLVKEITNKDQH